VTEHLVWLTEPACHRTEVSGGKGAGLGMMRSAGLPVPPGFVVTAAAFTDSLAEQGVLQSVQDLTAAFDPDDDGDGTARRIQDIVRGAPPWDDLAAEIAAAYERLGPGAFVAVRSSACSEDGDAASFAGQQETYLNVVGADDVLDRIVDCWASFFSERAMFYRRSKGSLADLGMAVVVQRQLASDKSGVLFTTDPIRQRIDQMVIEAVYGLGEALVSGATTPDHYIARLDGTLKTARVGRQDHMVVRATEGGTTTVDLDETVATAQVLDEGEIARLVAMGVELQRAFGSPQDVEWAFEGDELFALQSRPITA
jgi:pyruvate, water dikinase